jgi:hypothetical protein
VTEDPGRVTFLLVGLVTGIVIGGAVSVRFRTELDAVRSSAERADRAVEALDSERDRLTTELADAEARVARAEAALLALERATPDTPAERAERAREQAALEARKLQLLELLTQPSTPPAPPSR